MIDCYFCGHLNNDTNAVQYEEMKTVGALCNFFKASLIKLFLVNKKLNLFEWLKIRYLGTIG